jgi:hypothetical protein
LEEKSFQNIPKEKLRHLKLLRSPKSLKKKRGKNPDFLERYLRKLSAPSTLEGINNNMCSWKFMLKRLTTMPILFYQALKSNLLSCRSWK